jgi:hypothetical protein
MLEAEEQVTHLARYFGLRSKQHSLRDTFFYMLTCLLQAKKEREEAAERARKAIELREERRRLRDAYVSSARSLFFHLRACLLPSRVVWW